ncbi:hypothetical protein MVLG_07270, partial [Microbotryum lychnidis-dioicae p1A1 Lamole]
RAAAVHRHWIFRHDDSPFHPWTVQTTQAEAAGPKRSAQRVVCSNLGQGQGLRSLWWSGHRFDRPRPTASSALSSSTSNSVQTPTPLVPLLPDPVSAFAAAAFEYSDYFGVDEDDGAGERSDLDDRAMHEGDGG